VSGWDSSEKSYTGYQILGDLYIWINIGVKDEILLTGTVCV
jgi:hypothetical protein